MNEVRVKGIAKPGDKVTYFDMANQDGTVWEVFSTPKDNTHPEYGWSKGYGLLAKVLQKQTCKTLRLGFNMSVKITISEKHTVQNDPVFHR